MSRELDEGGARAPPETTIDDEVNRLVAGKGRRAPSVFRQVRGTRYPFLPRFSKLTRFSFLVACMLIFCYITANVQNEFEVADDRTSKYV